ncbi:hypothetical protein [Domibacillus tundrae]|uniref:hypothetical protein n=1 Tax=Domibacillus tundrae TaxID=1587527 RepID=UPI003394AF70
MSEVKKPTIQIKTASPACPDIVGDWAVGQKNPNESVKYLIIQMAAYFGNVDIFDPQIINMLNSMLSNKKAERMQPPIIKANNIRSNGEEEKAVTTLQKTAEKETTTKKKIDARFKTEPIGNMDILDLKLIDNLHLMFGQTEKGSTEPAAIKESRVKPKVEKVKAKTAQQEAGASPVKEGKEKNSKKKVGARPGTAPNIMQ